MVVYHHSLLQCNQEGNHFITSGFICPQILNFERNLSLPPEPQSSLVPPCKMYVRSAGGQPWVTDDDLLINSMKIRFSISHFCTCFRNETNVYEVLTITSSPIAHRLSLSENGIYFT